MRVVSPASTKREKCLLEMSGGRLRRSLVVEWLRITHQPTWIFRNLWWKRGRVMENRRPRGTISGGLSRGAVYPWHLCMWWAPRQGPGRLGVTEDAVWEGFTEVSWAGSSPSATLTEGWPVTDFQKHFPLVGVYAEPYVLLTQPKILLTLENYVSLGMLRGT